MSRTPGPTQLGFTKYPSLLPQGGLFKDDLHRGPTQLSSKKTPSPFRNKNAFSRCTRPCSFEALFFFDKGSPPWPEHMYKHALEPAPTQLFSKESSLAGANAALFSRLVLILALRSFVLKWDRLLCLNHAASQFDLDPAPRRFC